MADRRRRRRREDGGEDEGGATDTLKEGSTKTRASECVSYVFHAKCCRRKWRDYVKSFR